MDEIFRIPVSRLIMSEAMMYGYPTGLMHCFNPQVKQIYLPPLEWSEKVVEVRVKAGNTGPRTNGSRKWKAYRSVTRALGGCKTLDFSGKFVFDARDETDKNPAHIIENTLTSALLIKETLKNFLGKGVELHIVLRERASELVRESCELLNLPIITTDDDVKGEIAVVSDHVVPGLRPRLFNVDFRGSDEMSIDKIFISRRGNRSLINKDEVDEFLQGYGFKTLYFEDFSVSQKWSLARNAKFVVAINGAAGANIVFNRMGLKPGVPKGGGVKMLELLHPAWSHIGYRDNLEAINGRWCAVQGQVTPEILQAVDFFDRAPNPTKAPYCSPFKVDIGSIQMGLDYLESGALKVNPVVEVARVASPGKK